MKNKKFVSIMVGTALLANLMVFAAASAATTGTTTASSAVNAGGLAIVDIDATVGMSATTVSASASTSTGEGTVQFQSLRDSADVFDVVSRMDDDLYSGTDVISASA